MDRDEMIRRSRASSEAYKQSLLSVQTDQMQEKPRRWLGIWQRREGGVYMPGLNFTRLSNGFALAWCASTVRYRFGFRRGIKPMFLWSKE